VNSQDINPVHSGIGFVPTEKGCPQHPYGQTPLAGPGLPPDLQTGWRRSASRSPGNGPSPETHGSMSYTATTPAGEGAKSSAAR